LLEASNNQKMFTDILLVQGLEEWICNEKMYQLFHRCSWIHRDTIDSAYLCFDNSKDAYKVMFKFNQATISYNKLYQLYHHSEFVEDFQAILTLSYVRPFVFKRMNDMLKLPSYFDQERSCFLNVYTSCKLTINEWWQLFPRAFDIYKTVDSPKAFIQFSNPLDAFEAAQTVHQQSFWMEIRDVWTNVFVCCCFTNQEFIKQKVKLYKNQEIDNMLLLDNSKDKLYTRVVEWLYL
jgi:hypothetical protein